MNLQRRPSAFGSWVPSAAAVFVAYCAVGVLTGQNQPNASMRRALTAQTSPERVKELLLTTMFTTCPRPGAALPTMFLKQTSLHEYDDAWTKLIPLPLSNAERLDRIQYRGLVVVGGAAWRYFPSTDGEWSRRVDSRHIGRATTRELLYYAATFKFEGAVILIEKKNNEWSFTLNGPESFIEPDEFSPKKISCSAAMSDNPEK
jgi:hypothetical protein